MAADGADVLIRRLAALGALALLAAGCGGGGDSASPADIAQAAKKTSSTGSLEADFGIAGQGLSGTGSGVFDNGRKPAGQLNMTVDAGRGNRIPVDTVVTGDVFYMRSPAFARSIARGKQWIKLDLAKLARQRGVDLGGLLNASPTPNNALAYLAGTEDVEKVGGEQVGGEDTTHYKVRVDAAKKADGSAKSSLQGVRASGVKKLPMDVWLDPNGYIRKVSYHEHAGRQQAAKVTMQLHDFGSPVSIEPPPSDSVVDLTKLQGG